MILRKPRDYIYALNNSYKKFKKLKMKNLVKGKYCVTTNIS